MLPLWKRQLEPIVPSKVESIDSTRARLRWNSTSQLVQTRTAMCLINGAISLRMMGQAVQVRISISEKGSAISHGSKCECGRLPQLGFSQAVISPKKTKATS